MPFITQPTEEGEKMKCPNCGQELISRLKEYKDFPSKIQWQDKEQTKAHFDKTGNCKGQQENQSETTQTTMQSEQSQSQGESNPQEELETTTQTEMLARIYDMTKEMYHDFIDKKLKESK